MPVNHMEEKQSQGEKAGDVGMEGIALLYGTHMEGPPRNES